MQDSSATEYASSLTLICKTGHHFPDEHNSTTQTVTCGDESEWSEHFTACERKLQSSTVSDTVGLLFQFTWLGYLFHQRQRLLAD